MGRTDRRLRMVALLLVFVLFGAVATARLAVIGIIDAPELQQRAAARRTVAREELPIRGRILDRNGVVLAHTSFEDRLVAWPSQIGATRQAAIVEDIAAILELDGPARANLQTTLAGGGNYAVLARSVGAEQARAIREAQAAGRLGGLALEPQQVRVYPNPGGEPGTTLASQLLGFVTADGRGRYGIEAYYDELLSGREVMLASVALPGGAGLAVETGPGASAGGQDIHLTIDTGLQLNLEKQLYHAWVLDKARRVSGVVLDPHTGEVLAWASVPGYDANDYAETWRRNPGRISDPIATAVYEPGSVMKMFTAAAALSSGVVKPRSRVSDGLVLELNGQVVRNANHLSEGAMRFEDAIARSRNVATAKVAFRLEPTRRKSAERLFRTWQDFGIGRRTGIDIASEAKGIVYDPRVRPWSDLDLANAAFGQGVAITQIQLATAYAAMVNGGFSVRPHLLLSDPPRDERRQRVVSPKVAGQLRALLAHVTASVSYYAPGSLIRGYHVGGKTGTAQIWDSRTKRYLPRTFNFSFAGYVGGDRPEAVIAVRIHETRPKVIGQGDLRLQITSFELFRRIARDVIRAMAIPRSRDPGAGLPEPGSEAARKLGTDRRVARARDREPGRTTARGGTREARSQGAAGQVGRGRGIGTAETGP